MTSIDWFMERQTQSQRVTDHLIHANYLRSTPTHATVQAQTQREGLGYCWWYNSAVQQWYVPTQQSFIDDSVLYTAYNTVTTVV